MPPNAPLISPRNPRCGLGLLGTWLTKTLSETCFPQKRVTAEAAAYSQLRLYAWASAGKSFMIAWSGTACCAVDAGAEVAVAVAAVAATEAAGEEAITEVDVGGALRVLVSAMPLCGVGDAWALCCAASLEWAALLLVSLATAPLAVATCETAVADMSTELWLRAAYATVSPPRVNATPSRSRAIPNLDVYFMRFIYFILPGLSLGRFELEVGR